MKPVAKIHPGVINPPTGRPVFVRVDEIAGYFDVSAAAVRKACKAAGVAKAVGPAVAGLVEVWLESPTAATRSAYLTYFA